MNEAFVVSLPCTSEAIFSSFNASYITVHEVSSKQFCYKTVGSLPGTKYIKSTCAAQLKQ